MEKKEENLAGKRKEPEDTDKIADKEPVGKTLNDNTDKLESSAEASFGEELKLDEEIEDEADEIACQLESERREDFAEEYTLYKDNAEFWELVKTTLFKDGFIPHMYELSKTQNLVILPLHKDEEDDFIESVDNSYIRISMNKK